MAPTKVLVTGVTGFIGGTILSQLLSSDNSTTRGLQISVLTRDDERAEYFSSNNLTVHTILNLDDTLAITAAASENDIVIHAASGYHVASARALIEGLGKRKLQNPTAAVYYIHTSGTSNLADRPISQAYVEHRTFSDYDEDIYTYLRRLEEAEQYPQRTTDLAVVDTGKKVGVSTTIIMSPTIYGLGSGRFNRLTIQYPLQMRAAFKEGCAGYVGSGTGIWDFVHITDLAALYEIVLLDWIEAGGRVPIGERGFMFSGTGTFTWKDVAERIAKAGFEMGALESADTRSMSLPEAAIKWVDGNEQLCELGFASNAKTSADLALKLGWQPKKTRKDWEQSFLVEMEEVLEKEKRLT